MVITITMMDAPNRAKSNHYSIALAQSQANVQSLRVSVVMAS